jgi:hypothetical protein
MIYKLITNSSIAFRPHTQHMISILNFLKRENVIAIHCYNIEGGQGVDVGIIGVSYD